MAQKPMYEAVNNSIQTTITASITATESTIPLASVNGLPEAPNLITIGSDDDAEVVRYNSISGLNLTGCERGFAGTTAKVWLINELVYRAYTKYDHNTFKENIEELAESKLNKTGDASDVTAVFSVAAKRDNIASGEKLSIIAGKVAKWFGDLKALAFKDSVGTSEIDASSITNEKLAENAVNTANLMDGIVTADKLAEKAVAYGKISDNAVGTENLTSDSVTREKIVDGAVSQTLTVTIGTVCTGDEAPFTQTVSVSGLLASDRPIVDIVPAADYETAQIQLETWAAIYRITTADGSITVYATEKTEVALDIQMVVIRK